MTMQFADERAAMQWAIELAREGLGRVEPNPPVGAVIVDDSLNLLGEGAHQQYGGPHAEVHALRMAGEKSRGATLFVTLEPCCHQGQTPPCSRAVIEAGIARVVVAIRDPAPHVAGGGLRELRSAGIQVECGLLADEAAQLAAPFLKRVTTGRPFVHAKWAMTLDGKIASHTGHSQWISGELSRQKVHELRGRMDAIVVGSRTALLDDPLLTARPAGPKNPLRIVVDRDLFFGLDSRLMKTLDQAPLLIATSEQAAQERGAKYLAVGAELFPLPFQAGSTSYLDLDLLLEELGRREMTNVLVEGGGSLLGDLFDSGAIDACHLFLAPKLVGGTQAISPLGGVGLDAIPSETQFVTHQIQQLGEDIYWQGMLSTAWWRALQPALRESE